MSAATKPHIIICGGGPAGLFAAETASAMGASVDLYEKMPTPGRKLLVAGKGGLNLTHSGDVNHFSSLYHGGPFPEKFWQNCLHNFDNQAIRHWASELGIETFEQRTGRVYPREMKAAALLRRWLARLHTSGVRVHTRHSLTDFAEHNGRPTLTFSHPQGSITTACDAAILALGGGSWPRTGSDGTWTTLLEKNNIPITPLQAANCGWEAPWTEDLLQLAEGQPLKNISASANGEHCQGELLITQYGLEGGIIYHLGHALRHMAQPEIIIDLKPTFTAAQLQQKGRLAWKLSPAASALLNWSLLQHPGTSAVRAKHLTIPLTQPRPIAEAISTAGGVPWNHLDQTLRLSSFPSIFCCGEMIDWEAPTGGYLLQGCFATARLAAQAAVNYAVQSH